MANKQQTAVQMLIEQIKQIDKNGFNLQMTKLDELGTQALQMEREQIEQTFIKGNEFIPKWKINGVPYIESEQYYDQTYKKE